MTKVELRKHYKKKRSQLSEEENEALSLLIANQLLKLDIWNYLYYHIFLSITEQKELNTDYILNILSGKDKNIIISKSDFATIQMTHYLLTDNTVLKKNAHHIPEPVEGIEIPAHKIEVVFVPLLAFDLNGNRVGYGKGFYDQFLKTCRPDVLKIGLCHFEAEDQITEVFDSDIALDYCVTPEKIYHFKKN